jgi:hypothetical protein
MGAERGAVDVVRPDPAHSLDAFRLACRSIGRMSVKVREGEPDLLVLPARARSRPPTIP